jgi:ArsR family transcriptional regulator
LARCFSISVSKRFFFQFAFDLKKIIGTMLESARGPSLRLKNISLSSGTQVFKALADESRLRILNLLLFKDDLSISDLELLLEFTQTKTARLMGILKTAGLVQSRRQDYWVLYRLKEEAAELLEGLMELMEKDSQLQKDIRACEAMESNRELTLNKLALRRYKPRYEN